MGHQQLGSEDPNPHKTRLNAQMETRVDLDPLIQTRVDDEDPLIKTRVDINMSEEYDPFLDRIQTRPRITEALTDSDLDKLWDDVDLDEVDLTGSAEDIDSEEESDGADEHESNQDVTVAPQVKSETLEGLYKGSESLPFELALFLPDLRNEKDQSAVNHFLKKFHELSSNPSSSKLQLAEVLFSPAFSDRLRSNDLEGGEYVNGKKTHNSPDLSDHALVQEYRYLISSDGTLVILSFDMHQRKCYLEHILMEY
jgi:hypothetical protein